MASRPTRPWRTGLGNPVLNPAVLAGTLVVVPTGGEIPLIVGLAAFGLGKGALLWALSA